MRKTTHEEYGFAAADMILTGVVRLESSSPESINRAREAAEGWFEECSSREEDHDDAILFRAVITWLDRTYRAATKGGAE
jgi:hypothetical protein|tara:strand:- start:370 stop:609 length:240 start_codon:yes stop_codon:yes gene_type:complete